MSAEGRRRHSGVPYHRFLSEYYRNPDLNDDDGGKCERFGFDELATVRMEWLFEAAVGW
jgi:hypothetical protein